MIYDAKREAIERDLRAVQEFQPLDTLREFVNYVAEEKNPMDGENYEEQPEPERVPKLEGTLLLCPECGRNFLVPKGQMCKYPWKFQKQKNKEKTQFVFCTYTHMKMYQRAHRKELEGNETRTIRK